MNINNINNYTTILTNIITMIALIYAAIKWFQFSIKRTLYRNRKRILIHIQQFKKLNRHDKKNAMKGIKNYGKRIIQGSIFFPADEIDLLSDLLGIEQSLTFVFDKYELKDLAFDYMKMANNLKKRMFFGMDSRLIEEQSVFCVKVADLLFSRASLSKTKCIDSIDNRSTIKYINFYNDNFAYKLSVSWFKEMQTIDSKYDYGFDRGSRLSKYKSKVTINSKRSYDAVLPSLIEKDKKIMARTSIDDRNGEHYLELSIGETTYSSVESLRKIENQELNINKAITISMIIMSQDGKVLVPKRSTNNGIDGYHDYLTTSVNGNLDIPTRLFGNTDYDYFGLPDFYKAIVREAREELNIELNYQKIIVHGIVQIFTKSDYGTWVLCMSYRSNRTVEELDKYIKTNSNTLGKYETSDFYWLTLAQLEQPEYIEKRMPHLIASHNLLKKYLSHNN